PGKTAPPADPSERSGEAQEGSRPRAPGRSRADPFPQSELPPSLRPSSPAPLRRAFPLHQLGQSSAELQGHRAGTPRAHAIPVEEGHGEGAPGGVREKNLVSRRQLPGQDASFLASNVRGRSHFHHRR